MRWWDDGIKKVFICAWMWYLSSEILINERMSFMSIRPDGSHYKWLLINHIRYYWSLTGAPGPGCSQTIIWHHSLTCKYTISALTVATRIYKVAPKIKVYKFDPVKQPIKQVWCLSGLFDRSWERSHLWAPQDWIRLILFLAPSVLFP